MLLSEIAAYLQARVIGDASCEISSVANLKTAQAGQISFLSDSRYKEALASCQASAVIVKEADAHLFKGACLILDDPYVGYAKVAKLLDTTPAIACGISKLACIEDNVVLGKNVGIGPFVHIKSGAVIGDNVQIGAHCSIGENTIIGDETKLYPNVVLYHNVSIGSHCLIQSGTVIGSDGFGYANEKGKWLKIPQTGKVVIGNFVEIGANTCIDRGAIDNTIIEDNVIIDNLCQIAHNVKIGTGTAVAGGTTFAGSVTIGKYCIIGGTSVFNGHISICDMVTISGMCMVMRSIDKPGIYSSGIPAQTNKQWRLTAARVLHINDMYHKVNEMEKQLLNLQEQLKK